MSNPDLEALTTTRIREALLAATDKIGKKEFAAVAGITQNQLDQLLVEDGIFLQLKIVTVACQVNKIHGDIDPKHSSVSECIKGVVFRIPLPTMPAENKESVAHSSSVNYLRPRRAAPAFFDQKSVKIMNFSANTATFLILGYFLGGILLAPLFGLPVCVGIISETPWLAPCLGSVLGLISGSFAGLAYTYYYFTRKL